MLQTVIDHDYRVTIPETLRQSLRIGDKLLVSVDQTGRIFLVPEDRALQILADTAGMWRDRTDIPSDGVEYVNQLRQGNRLQDLGILDHDRD